MKEKEITAIHMTMLKLLADINIESQDVRKAILISCDSKLIKIIGEIALNLLRGNLPLSYYYKKKLEPHVDIIRRIGSEKVKGRQRKQLCSTHPNIVALLIKSVLNHVIATLGHSLQ